MADIKTVQRIDVNLSLESEEAKALNDHLAATTNPESDNLLLSIAQALNNAVNPPQRKPREPKDPNAVKTPRKTKEQKAQEAAAAAAQPAAQPQKVNTQAAAAPANTQAAKAPATAQAVAPKKVTVNA